MFLYSIIHFIFFRIKHFGGVVTYDSRDFVERNRDALDRELSQAMYECDHPILKVLFPEGKIFWRNLVFLAFWAHFGYLWPVLITFGHSKINTRVIETYFCICTNGIIPCWMCFLQKVSIVMLLFKAPKLRKFPFPIFLLNCANIWYENASKQRIWCHLQQNFSGNVSVSHIRQLSNCC